METGTAGERACRFAAWIAAALGVREEQVAGTATLLAGGATVPFIARYRKEATGCLDEVAIAAVRDRLAAMERLEERRETVLASLREQGVLTPDLAARVMGAESLAVLEDLYLPFRPGRRTRASAARELGLAPLAAALLGGECADPLAAAQRYVRPDGPADAAAALAGASDIVAATVSEDAGVRASMRRLFMEAGVLTVRAARGKDLAATPYADYAGYTGRLRAMPGHRVHAVLRGAREGLLSVTVAPPERRALGLMGVRGRGPASEVVAAAVQDGYRRLLAPAMERESLAAAKARADEEAVQVFAANLRRLLLAPPLGRKTVLAVDPGFAAGCKVACLDRQGTLLHATVVRPLPPHRQEGKAGAVLADLCRRYGVEVVAVGNGHGGREARAFLLGLGLGVPVITVSECGASVYSASAEARREFPDLDLTLRSAVSIGRRLQDPLAELVKIDPQALGVGQYQHDVDGRLLAAALDDTVVSAVNAVGVEVNTASAPLLARVSGIGQAQAARIVGFREEHGPFGSRRALLKVPGIGPKTFEQAAGFLRVVGGADPLDATAVHPMHTPVVRAMADDLGVGVGDLVGNPALLGQVEPERYVHGAVGLPTVHDICAELAAPGRDPRPPFDLSAYEGTPASIDDLAPGMALQGTVTNVTAFGAFVDVGVGTDGLVHVSELADAYVARPLDVVGVHDRVAVTVLSVDLIRRRIALSMRERRRG
ncbi:S1 RNA-binding domain-containing protein [Methanofollis formosanus]|uniref:S1 RNA-binding domain-containing protein n=1 Tax=Methanofollis formosanus TaxID=299308 RepID=A0A8G0ZWD3_9EURY|nr:Tex-like N-terminal domain-containing protein [Methanofollis formosanus]QYZ78019.1 S1 RNA-binding domain-containing protein [Methanofollis formosanus]